MPSILAVLVAALIPMGIGALWYGPLFGKQWMLLVGKTEEEIVADMNPLKMYGTAYVSFFVMAYVLGVILQAWQDAYDMTGAWTGMQGAFWCWLGFILTSFWQGVTFESKPPKLYLMNVAYNLFSLLGMGALLGIWR